MTPAPIAIPQATLDRIHVRVADAVIGYAPDDDAGAWQYGVDARWLAGLRDHWRDRYDWRSAEARFNEWPSFEAEIDGVAIHFIHARAVGGDGYPLLLTHGWPGSVLEFLAVIPLLVTQGYDVIVPSLPGYGFSGRPSRPIGPTRTAAMWRTLMIDVLGYRRFGAQGGDWGSMVTRALARDHCDVVGAIHLNMMSASGRAPVTPELTAYYARVAELMAREGAYAAEHRTKPQTIGLALADSPIGFAGWVIEKCRSWSDCDGDVESIFSKDALITNVMTYLVGGNVQAGIWMYRGMAGDPPFDRRIEVPTGFAEYPAEFMPPPPRDAMAVDLNLVRWTKMAKGGHFAAWEQPAPFADEVGSFFNEWR
ncbi:epoxide hydrolase family protein [Sphingomonas bacterium]|uniref:epoxide hydrolase family protein n=1 Tax=Sphingomonas bacterium TaxID=1895847 RepID=UPI0020C648EB|nr:epoxide hydrolase family protein [Sphingomonas bacterium]